MNFNTHGNIKSLNRHAFLSPSNYHWLNYDETKLHQMYEKSLAQERGIKLHELAKSCIEMNVQLPRTKASLNQFVNDAIGYRMTPEQVLFYSYNAFGTCDAISFKNKLLRVHDLKTGVNRVHMFQLEIYAALFCLEYQQDPTKIDMELRIYQGNNVIIHNPEKTAIRRVMEKIKIFDQLIDNIIAKEGI